MPRITIIFPACVMNYYDWNKTFSYNEKLNLVITSRGRGKTFGLRYQCVKNDFLRDGYRFVELVRVAEELKGVELGYFDKLQEVIPELQNYSFKVESHRGYIAKKLPEDNDKKQKLDWKLLCYFCDLNGQQAKKKHTFANVKTIIFDEAIIEASDRWHDYLPREFYKVGNFISSVARQQPGEQTPVRLFMLGNACDLVNPYFQAFKIYESPAYGYTKIKNPDPNNKLDLLLHFEEAGEYAHAVEKETFAGQMLAMTEEGRAMTSNKFTNDTKDFIAGKTEAATFEFGIVYEKQTFGVWLDIDEGYYYVNKKIPKNRGRKNVFALTLADHTPNYILAKRNSKLFKEFVNMQSIGLVKYDSPATRWNISKVLTLFGAR